MNNTLANLTWGTEIELVGLSIEAAAAVVAEATAGTVGASYDGRTVTMMDGRMWLVVRDGSLSGGALSAEVVTPIMRGADDVEIVQNVIRALRTAGARVDSTCGQHVHVGVGHLTPRQLTNAVRLAYRFESVITRAGGVQERRLGQYCKLTPRSTIDRLSKAKTKSDLNKAWYGQLNTAPRKYDHSRYAGINLNSFFLRGTVEFRWFEGTLHAGEFRANLMLCLGMVAFGAARPTSLTVIKIEEAGLTARRECMGWLLGLVGLKGDKTVVEHLTKRLPTV